MATRTTDRRPTPCAAVHGAWAAAMAASAPERGVRRSQSALWSSVVVAPGILAASAYGLLAADPYRGLPDATVLGAKAQDVCSVVVAGLLLWLVWSRETTPLRHLVRMGLLAYVAYSYAIYLTGVPMNRVFLVYVLIESASLAALADGVFRLRGSAWHRIGSRRLERGTGWMLLVVAVLFALLWLSTLMPFALGGSPPDPAGVGGTPYPVFVLDLVVVLPCIGAVGWLLLRGRRVGGPLAIIALIKIITLFTALWAGVVAVVVTGQDLHLGPDAGPSLALLAASCWLALRWSTLRPAHTDFLRPALWEEPPPVHEEKEKES